MDASGGGVGPARRVRLGLKPEGTAAPGASVTNAQSTCWVLIQGARAGRAQDREDLARRYLPVVQAYLGARWRGDSISSEIEDAVQEVFLECFRPGGLLDRVDPKQPGGFRAFLYGAARIVALRFERRAGRLREREITAATDVEARESDDPSLSQAFDRAWATSLLREAASLQKKLARELGEGEGGRGSAMARVELLRLRFQEDIPIREIARLWDVEAATLHKEYARAREEFRAALEEVVSFHLPGSPAEIARECADLLGLVR